MADTVPDPDERFVTLADLATFLNASSFAQAGNAMRDLLDETLNAALEQVADRVGPLTDLSRTYQAWPSGRSLVVPDDHLTAVVSVTSPTGAALTVPVEGLNLLAGVLTFRAPLSPGAYAVQYTARQHGASVALAVKIIASHLWQVQRGTSSGLPSTVIPVGDPDPVPAGFAFPRRAVELLAPFLRPRGTG